MEPFTRDEIYMAAAAGEYDGELPEPVTRPDYYWIEIIERINAGASVDPEEINAAIADYLNTHDADIVTEAELAEALAGYYNKSTVDNALAGKAAASHTHAQSDITDLADALAGKAAASHTHDDRYYTESEMDTKLGEKSNTGHLHDDRYYTESEMDTKLGEKSNTGHLHDDRYYTESEVDTLLSAKAGNSDIPDVSAFITKAVNDLTHYYTKSQTYTQTEIDNMVSAIPKFAIEVVQALPSQNISPTTVYLLTVQSGQQGNMYDEYIHVGNSWELLGTQTVDLSGYYTSAQVDALLNGLPVAGHTHDDRYYTETEIDGKFQDVNTALSGKAAASHTHDDRYYTETEIDNKLGGKSNTGHSHVTSDVTGLDSALAGKAAADHNHSGVYAAASHTHAQSEITDLATTLAGKAAASHTHAQSDITDLATTLAGKAAASHTHAQSDITDLATTLAGKAAASHTHTKSEITDLANATASSGGVGGSAGLLSPADKEKLDKMLVISEAAYEALNPPDSGTLYFVLEASGS